MPAWVWILIAVAVVVIAAVAVVGWLQQRRSGRLQSTFGPEYQRTVEERGNRREAERELEGRYQRRQQLDIRPLDPEARDRYVQQWTMIQARFVDVPADAIQEADTTVMAVMRDRGYPVTDFEQRAADVSVDHADVVDNYRKGHEVARRTAQGTASTEDMRQGMIHYRALFEKLLGAVASRRREEEAVAQGQASAAQEPR
jgi:hypothetical protein